MTLNKFNLPDVGEGLTEAEVVSWKVKPGDSVAINDVICEIETASTPLASSLRDSPPVQTEDNECVSNTS